MVRSESTIGAYDAKTHFSALLERVAAGEAITITWHGQPVAQLVPVRKVTTVDERKEVIKAMRALAKDNRLRGLKVKDLIEEGRR
ncbi:MAG: type II toxin-antitoxin system prevent-host-death family antitoxin [Pirellulales bacterium]